MPHSTPDYYRDQQAWRDLQQFLPERLRLTDQTAPQEEYWDHGGHRVHLDRYPNPDAKAKGYETVALDNLGYGLTKIAPGAVPSYDDWVDLVVDFLAYEQSRDGRPIVLYGLSAGGMLTYHVAAKAPKGTLAGIVGMTFLDQRIQQVRDETSHDIVSSRAGIPLMGALAKTPVAGMKYPMSLASKMGALANDPAAMKVLMRDRTSAANWVSIRFIATYGNYAPAVEPEQFDACPVLHTQPGKDRWTPQHLSDLVLPRIHQSPR